MNSKIISEFLGMLLLTMSVVGSGIMAENLSQGNAGLTLLSNSYATALMLIVIIVVFRNHSGAHFNPAVSLSFYLQGKLSSRDFVAYVTTQIIAGILAVVLIHLIFSLPLIDFSVNDRSGIPIMISEVIASFFLVFIILMSQDKDDVIVAVLVGLYIGSAYFFTSSTSFANPAITIARSLTDTFTGINPSNIFGFISSQIIGAFLATILYKKVIN
jgi:glycerol uptake facilitator-like aquaporin|tara:strand:- start:2153 stop:2797 length:645 start_codon:yes stop_codon:yes gene_type:complete